jgi:hypothetical protein
MRPLALPFALSLTACAAPAIAPPHALPAAPPPSAERVPPPRGIDRTAANAEPLPPAFPEGWIRPAAASPLDPPPKTAPRSLARLAENTRKPPIAVAPFAIRVADLPRVEVEPEPDWDKPPKALPPVQRLDDVFVSRGQLALRGKAFGFVQSTFSTTGIRHAAWETLAMRPDGDLQYRGASAWFDYESSRPHLVARVESRARDIAGGLAYAFRTACPRCKRGGETLHLLAPLGGWGDTAFTHARLPLSQGEGESRVMRFSDAAIRAFRESGARPARTTHTRLGVEVAQVTGEAEPVLVVYVTDDVPGSD